MGQFRQNLGCLVITEHRAQSGRNLARLSQTTTCRRILAMRKLILNREVCLFLISILTDVSNTPRGKNFRDVSLSGSGGYCGCGFRLPHHLAASCLQIISLWEKKRISTRHTRYTRHQSWWPNDWSFTDAGLVMGVEGWGGESRQRFVFSLLREPRSSTVHPILVNAGPERARTEVMRTGV